MAKIIQEVVQLPLNLLDDHPDNNIFQMDEHKLQELGESIADVGVLQPILVKSTENGRFRIVSGHRRKRASTLVGLETAPCIVLGDEIDEGIALVDTNLRTRELGVMEKARAVRYLKQRIGVRRGPGGRTNFGNDFPNLSEMFQDSDRNLRNYDKLNDLIPQLQEFVERGVLGLTAGVRMASLPAYAQKELFDALGDDIRDIGPDEIRKLKEQNDRGYLVLEVMQKKINGLEQEIEKRKAMEGEAEDLERKINTLRSKKRELEFDLMDHQNAVKAVQERATKQGAVLYTIVEQVSRPVAGVKPKIESLLETQIEAATATHLLKWSQVLIEVGQLIEKAVHDSLNSTVTTDS